MIYYLRFPTREKLLYLEAARLVAEEVELQYRGANRSNCSAEGRTARTAALINKNVGLHD